MRISWVTVSLYNTWCPNLSLLACCPMIVQDGMLLNLLFLNLTYLSGSSELCALWQPFCRAYILFMRCPISLNVVLHNCNLIYLEIFRFYRGRVKLENAVLTGLKLQQIRQRRAEHGSSSGTIRVTSASMMKLPVIVWGPTPAAYVRSSNSLSPSKWFPRNLEGSQKTAQTTLTALKRRSRRRRMP